MTEAITYAYGVFYIVRTTEAEIQLPLKRLPDSSVSSLIRSWLASGRASGQNSSSQLPMNGWQLVDHRIRLLPDCDFSVNFCKMSPKVWLSTLSNIRP